MARYIFIDKNSGYIFGDSADINGKIVTGSPVEVARSLDESIGEHGRSYVEHGFSSSITRDTSAGYFVYRSDVRGSDQIANIHDGQDQEMIAAVERDCEPVCYIECRSGE